MDIVDAARARAKCHLGQLLLEGGQQFLRHPGSAQHPAALVTVADGDPVFGYLICVHDRLEAIGNSVMAPFYPEQGDSSSTSRIFRIA